MTPPIPLQATKFLQFVNASPTPFHAVVQSIIRLEAAGFSRISERDAWSLKAGGKHYITRNQSSIIAFTVPAKLSTTKPLGMSIVGCHTDSPRFIVKPISRKEKAGYSQVGVETYGGGLWATWMDRDLGCAGKVILKRGDKFSSHLFHHKAPILRMPSVAIHLNRTQNEKYYYNPYVRPPTVVVSANFVLSTTDNIDRETQQVPILAMASKSLNTTFPSQGEVKFDDPLDITSHHHPVFLHTVAGALSAEMGEEVLPSQIHDFEISLFDTQDAVVGGALNEFIFSSRIDNLFSSFCAVEGITASVAEGKADDGRISMIALWDHEEVGSVSAFGAESNFVEATIERIAVSFKKEDESAVSAYQRTLASSFLLSTDMAHAVHPGFTELHEESMRPALNAGPVIKTNTKQRYASTSQTTFLLRRIAEKAGVPLQEFGVRNDQACGSTIGPLVAKIGLRTVDIGCPQLAMHSIREQAGAADVAKLISLFENFFESFGEVDNLEVD